MINTLSLGGFRPLKAILILLCLNCDSAEAANPSANFPLWKTKGEVLVWSLEKRQEHSKCGLLWASIFHYSCHQAL